MWSIIGGSGFENFEGFEAVEELSRETPFGLASEGFKKVRLEGKEILFIPRHGSHHDLLPSEVNYQANIFALRKQGATKLLAFSAVGSLQNEYAPGDMVIPEQFIDRTKGVRKTSYCGKGLVGHVSLAEPVTSPLVQVLKDQASSFDFTSHFGKTLVVMEGPHFSTKGESHLYRSWNADIIGMTSFPEYALAREAGLAYMNACFVTDYDCWKDDIPHVTVEQVIQVMRQNNQKAYKVAQKMIHESPEELESLSAVEQGLKHALLAPMDQLPSETRQWVEVLTQ